MVYVLKASLSILHNLARVPENKDKFAELDAVEVRVLELDAIGRT